MFSKGYKISGRDETLGSRINYFIYVDFLTYGG
jgi:hypothetical protein